ncbi:MAG: YIP1 family protein [Rhodobacterales bacterium]|nr:YIP1 family protein [Rhodobacterales bacterium]MDX5414263.1 YIP1 family protein [Rhodobacterales bacterium]
MKLNDLPGLAIETLRDPRGTAARLIALDLDLPTIWTALALGAVLNAMIFSVNIMLFPTTFPMQGLFSNPILYAVAMAGGMVIAMHLRTWVGGMMGGQGRLADVTVVLVWLQYLRVAAQALLLLMTILVPALALMAMMVVAFYSIWLMLTFLDVAHRFESLGKAALLLVFTVVGIIMGLSFLIALIGVPVPEMS